MAERFSPLWELTAARFREFVRQPEAVFWSFGFPMLLALALGIAFRHTAPAPARVGLVEGHAPWLAQALGSADDLELVVLPEGEAADALRRGGVDLLVEEESEGGVRYRYDPVRGEARTARLLVDEALQVARGRTNVLAVAQEHVSERGSRYIDFLFPGLLGLNVMGSSLWGIGFSTVLARKQKLLKRLAATPMRRRDFLAAMFLSRLLFLAIEVLVLLLFGALAFDVGAGASVTALAVLSLLGAASFGALSLVVAARVATMEAANGWLNLIALPMWLLSGTFFSYERFPDAMHPVIRALPLTALNDALRAVMNEARPLASVGLEVLVLALWAVGGFLCAQRLFRWQ